MINLSETKKIKLVFKLFLSGFKVLTTFQVQTEYYTMSTAIPDAQSDTEKHEENMSAFTSINAKGCNL